MNPNIYNLTIDGQPYRSLRFFPPWDETSIVTLHGLMHLVQDIQQNAKNNSRWVEIGTFMGESATLFLGFNYIKKLHCVDVLKCRFAEKRLKFEINAGRCEIHTKSSLLAAEEINEVDVVYIDGDHSYESAKSDIEAWWPKIPEGGVLAGHDYQLPWPGVIQAVDEFLKEHPELELKRYVDTSWAIFK